MGSLSQSARGSEQKNTCPCQELNPGHPPHSKVTILTVSQLLMLLLKAIKIYRRHKQTMFTQTLLTIFMEKLAVQAIINIHGIAILICMYPVAK
jgi:hypothetical protein